MIKPKEFVLAILLTALIVILIHIGVAITDNNTKKTNDIELVSSQQEAKTNDNANTAIFIGIAVFVIARFAAIGNSLSKNSEDDERGLP